MKKNYLYIILIALAAILAAGFILMLLRGDEDTWLCQDGQWVKHGQPYAAAPETPCE